MSKKTLIIIPTYNEIQNIEAIIQKVFDQNLGVHILVIDDGSPDGTADAVKEIQKTKDTVHLIEREGKLGLGSAYVRGFKYGLEHGYDYLFEMDADFSHDPTYLKDFLEAIEHHDLVIGSRYKDGKISVVNWDWKRLVLSYGANLYTRFITRLPVSDGTGGFKCFRREALESLNLDNIKSDGYCFQIEVNYKLWKKNMRIGEIPIIFTDRTAGESKMSGKIISEAFFILWRLRFGKN